MSRIRKFILFKREIVFRLLAKLQTCTRMFGRLMELKLSLMEIFFNLSSIFQVKHIYYLVLMVNIFKLSKDQTMVITASKDKTAKLFDGMNLEHRKTYKSNAPVNSAAIR
jgi:hypothetical protein